MGIERIVICMDVLASTTNGVERLVMDNAEDPPAPGAAGGVESCPGSRFGENQQTL